jgi:hypothetical protein
MTVNHNCILQVGKHAHSSIELENRHIKQVLPFPDGEPAIINMTIPHRPILIDRHDVISRLNSRMIKDGATRQCPKPFTVLLLNDDGSIYRKFESKNYCDPPVTT